MADPTPWLDDDQQRVWQSLLTVVIALPAALDRQLQRDAGISNYEYNILARLSETDGGSMRLGELARGSDGTLPRLSKTVDRFESRGWVVRRTDPTDGRFTLAALTAAGRKKVVAAAPAHVARVRELVFDALSPTQQRQLGSALSRVADSVRADAD